MSLLLTGAASILVRLPGSPPLRKRRLSASSFSWCSSFSLGCAPPWSRSCRDFSSGCGHPQLQTGDWRPCPYALPVLRCFCHQLRPSLPPSCLDLHRRKSLVSCRQPCTSLVLATPSGNGCKEPTASPLFFPWCASGYARLTLLMIVMV